MLKPLRMNKMQIILLNAQVCGILNIATGLLELLNWH